MPLTTDEIDWITDLARLHLTTEERRALPEQLRQIVGFVDQLEGFETDSSDDGDDGWQPTVSGPIEAEDEPAPGLPRRQVLANAPASARGEEPLEGFFVVPEVR